MLKHIWICAACFVGSSLAAETIGSVEFQFPPSNNEWRIFVDDSIIENSAFFDDDDDEEFEISADYQWGTPLDDEDELESVPSRFKLFTHREGEALEIFIAYQDNSPDWDEEDDEVDTLEAAQKGLDESINKYLPNHRMILHSLTDRGEDGLVEWELNDGIQDIMHGFTRIFATKVGGDLESLTILGYLTTSPRSEYNKALWTNALNQAR